MDDFEQFLNRQPPRPLPPEWRAGILAAARAGREEDAEPASAEPAPLPAHPWWLAWLWPSPTAWAAVACAWLVILGLNAASQPEAAGAGSGPVYCSSVELPACFAAQQRQLHLLLRGDVDPAQPRDAIPLPRGNPGALVRPPTQTVMA
ncbi:MAG: hypothetical protein PHQ12_01610 [Chthoniobacteraceae bacterium]|nr:hypothetical protein [Chthoniobacteraceae bacterium]